MLVGAKRFALCYNISMPAIFAFRNGIYDVAQTVKSIYLTRDSAVDRQSICGSLELGAI